MIQSINLEVVVSDMDEAMKLDSALSESGADCSVGRKHAKWTVFASFDQNDAQHVGRAILSHE